MLGSGDDLTIAALFIGGGLTLVMTAVTIHGWKHWIVLTIIWALAVIWLLIGVTWHWAKEISPKVFTDAIVEGSKNPLTYTVFALLLATLLVMIRKPNATTATKKDIPSGKWFSTKDAFSRFSDPMHKQAYGDAAKTAQNALFLYELEKSSHERWKNENKSWRPMASQMASSPNYEQQDWVKKLTYALDVYNKAVDTKDICYKEMVEEIRKALCEGRLIAKGISKSTPEKEQIIADFQWRFLSLDIEKGEANGDNVNYVGVVISKPE